MSVNVICWCSAVMPASVVWSLLLSTVHLLKDFCSDLLPAQDLVIVESSVTMHILCAPFSLWPLGNLMRLFVSSEMRVVSAQFTISHSFTSICMAFSSVSSTKWRTHSPIKSDNIFCLIRSLVFPSIDKMSSTCTSLHSQNSSYFPCLKLKCCFSDFLWSKTKNLARTRSVFPLPVHLGTSQHTWAQLGTSISTHLSTCLYSSSSQSS